MKILGIGVDIIQNSRIKKAINNKSFVSRIFSKSEITNSKKKIINLTILLRDLLQKKPLLSQ